MNPGIRIIRISAGIYIAIIVIIILFFILSFFDKKTFISILTGTGIVSLNFAAGAAAIKAGYKKTSEIFLLSVFGSLVVRLFIMLGLVIISLKFLELNRNSFIFSILFFYIFFLIVEILYLNSGKR